MTEFVRAWMDSSFVVKLHFHILFGVVVVTLVRTVRLSLRRRQADSILVRSTRGLARASLFLSGGAAAAALNDALILFGTTSGSGVDTLVEQHRSALTLIAVSLGLCAFVYAAGLVMEVLLRGWPPRAHVDQRCARRDVQRRRRRAGHVRRCIAGREHAVVERDHRGTFRASAFDIAGSDSARGYALINSSGDEEIVLIDLAAGGAVRDVYAFTNGLTGLRGLAVRSYPSTLWGLDRNNRLSQFTSSRPSQILRTLDITGLQAGEKVIGIDYAYLFPPFLDDVFFGVTDQNRLYRISPDTGVATQAGLYSGGHGAVGVTSPANEWFLAEGATGPFFDTFVLLANPGTNDASATVTFLPASGAPVQVTKSVAAGGRTTINIETEDPTLDSVPVATKITSTQPIVVERAMYWPGNGLT